MSEEASDGDAPEVLPMLWPRDAASNRLRVELSLGPTAFPEPADVSAWAVEMLTQGHDGAAICQLTGAEDIEREQCVRLFEDAIREASAEDFFRRDAGLDRLVARTFEDGAYTLVELQQMTQQPYYNDRFVLDDLWEGIQDYFYEIVDPLEEEDPMILDTGSAAKDTRAEVLRRLSEAGLLDRRPGGEAGPVGGAD